MADDTPQDGGKIGPSSTGLAEILGIFSLFLAAGAVFTWPMVLYFFSGITYGYDAKPEYATAPMFMGDHLQYYYHLGLLKYAALGKIEWFTNPLEFATEYRPQWLFFYSLPLSVAMYLPFSFISLTFAYNAFQLLAIGLAGLCMYLWAKERTGSPMAALAAGVVFNFFPIRMVEVLGGHPSGFIYFMFPLALYFFDRMVRKKSLVSAFWGGMFTAVLAVQYNFFAYFLFMFLMAYIPWRIYMDIMKDPDRPGDIAALAKPYIPSFALLGGWYLVAIGWMFYFKKTMVEKSAMGKGRSWGEVENFSPQLWSAWDTSRGWEVYLGLAFFFAVFALVLLAAGALKQRASRLEVAFFLAIFTGSYMLAFGTSLDQHINLYSLFYKYFPYFNLSRSPTKIMIITISCLSILTAYCVAWLMTVRPAWPKAAAGVFMLALVFDYHPGKPVGICLLDKDNEAYKYIASTGDNRPVLNIPVWPGESAWESIYQYYAVEHFIPMVNGYSPLVKEDYINHIFWPLAPMNGGDMDRIQADVLRKQNVGFVVFHADAYPPKVGIYSPYFAVKRLSESPFLTLVYKKDPIWVFKLENPSGAAGWTPAPSRLGSMFEAENLNWIGGKREEDPQASRGMVLKAVPGAEGMPEDGIINAGPYATFPSGKYKATFRIKAVGDVQPEASIIRIDAAADQGKIMLAKRDITGAGLAPLGEYHDIELEYSLAPGKFWQVEYRAYLTGGASISFDYVHVTSIGAEGPENRYEAESLRYYSGRMEDDPLASDGMAISSSPGVNPADVMVFGPQDMFQPGKWRAYVRLKAGQGSGALAAIDVYAGYAQKPVAQREVALADLGGPDIWKEVAVDFSLERRTPVEAAVRFGGVAPLSVDYIRFEKL